MKRFLLTALKNKIIVAIAVVIVAAGAYGAYRMRHGAVTVRYITTPVTRGTIAITITGTGQVSAANQVAITSKVGGTLTYLLPQHGQEIAQGTVIATVDDRDARNALRAAQIDLETQQVALKKLTEPADKPTLLQAQNAVTNAQTQTATDQNNLQKAYNDGFTNMASAFSDLKTVMTGLSNVLFGTTIQKSIWDIDSYPLLIKNYNAEYQIALGYRQDTYTAYQTADNLYIQSLNDYQAANRASATSTIVALLQETQSTLQSTAQAIKSASTLVTFVDQTLNVHTNAYTAPTYITSDEASLTSYTNTANSDLSIVLASQNTIQSDTTAVQNDQNNVLQTQAALEKLVNGPTAVDIEAQQVAIAKAQNAVVAAQNTLSDYTVRALLDGILAANVNMPNVGGIVNSGAAIATLTTKNQYVEVPLNEVDAAKVAVGNKAQITFSALSGVTLGGSVAQIDTLGTVTQGVVTYNVKIALAARDDRIKPGMSAAAKIITATKDNVLLVPNQAIKGSGTKQFVLVLANGVPQSVPIATGLSNDTATEVTSGLAEGELIIVRTASSGTQVQSTGGGGSFVGGGANPLQQQLRNLNRGGGG